jgi:hypothetical protein
MKAFLQNWRDTLGQDLKFMLPIVDELLTQEEIDLDAVIEERYAMREASKKFGVEFMFHWSVITYFEDINSRFKQTGV